MPPRYAYWTILVDGGPTAFRAAEPDELLPTLKRLQVKQPGAVMKWFEKGRLWESRDEAREKLGAGYTVGADGALVPPAEGAATRTKSWRPGGEHRDPREKYQLAKKAKWQKFKQMVRSRPGHGRKPAQDEVFTPLEEAEAKDPVLVDQMSSDGDSFEPPEASDRGSGGDEGFDDAGAAAPPSPPQTDWRGRPKPAGAGLGRPPSRARAPGDRPKFGGRDDRPRGPKPAWRDRGPKTSFDRGGDRPRGPKPEWRDKPGSEWRGKPAGGGAGGPAWKPRPDTRGPKPEWRDRGPKPEWRERGAKTFDRGGDRPQGPRPEWRDKPKGEWRGKPGGPSGGPRPAWKPRPDGDRLAWKPRPDGDRAPKTFDRSGDRPRGPKPEWRDRGPKTFDRGDDRPRGPKPEWRDTPKGDWRGKPGGASGGARPAWKPKPEGARGPKPEWRDRGPKTFDRGDDRPKTFSREGSRPPGDRPRSPKPGGFGRGPKPGGFGPKGRGRSGPPRPKKS
jgi:hypothetical protein